MAVQIWQIVRHYLCSFYNVFLWVFAWILLPERSNGLNIGGMGNLLERFKPQTKRNEHKPSATVTGTPQVGELSSEHLNVSNGGQEVQFIRDEFGAQPKEQDPPFKVENSTDGAENLTGVMVITPLPSQATVDFFGKLEERLRGACQICLTEMDVNTFNKEDKEGNLVMVICNNHGRINADVKNALKDINECLYQRMFVIILHCKKEKHLSTEPLCGKLKADFPNVHHFVEMAFDQDLPVGIFDCDMNNNALKDIAQKKDEFKKECQKLVFPPTP